MAPGFNLEWKKKKRNYLCVVEIKKSRNLQRRHSSKKIEIISMNELALMKICMRKKIGTESKPKESIEERERVPLQAAERRGDTWAQTELSPQLLGPWSIDDDSSSLTDCIANKQIAFNRKLGRGFCRFMVSGAEHLPEQFRAISRSGSYTII